MNLERLSHLRIVLVETTHPGNIGATARAMKVMGLRHLALVRPSRFPCLEATARASGADDILAQAPIHETLEEALRDCALVIGTSARSRTIPWPVLTPRECGVRAVAAAANGPVALVFGREHSGLTNDEVERCHALVRIPTESDFSSLNVAAAAQILAYECRMAALAVGAESLAVSENAALPASAGQLDQLYEHLERTMTAVGFFDPAKPRRLLRRVRRLFNRAELDQNELNILRGFLAAVDDKITRRIER